MMATGKAARLHGGNQQVARVRGARRTVATAGRQPGKAIRGSWQGARLPGRAAAAPTGHWPLPSPSVALSLSKSHCHT